METTAAPTTQYQHFVPQFLLRNFSHPYKPAAGSRRRGPRKDDNGLYRGSSVVHVLDFTAEPPAICEKAVKRVFGQVNMYEVAAGGGGGGGDRDAARREQRVEEMLAKLE